MSHLLAPATSPFSPPAVPRSSRRGALFILMLAAAAAACGARPSRQPSQGPARVSTIVSQSAMVCVSPAHPAATGGCIVQDTATGISLRVANAYADATSTVVQLETTNTAGYSLQIEEPQLSLSSGRTFKTTGGEASAPTSFTMYEPVPPADGAPLE